MTMFDQMRESLLAQKTNIESRGQLKGKDLELNLGTFVIKKGEKYYSNGNFSFDDPDEFSRFEATQIAFTTGGAVFKSEVYWGRKYTTICQALDKL